MPVKKSLEDLPAAAPSAGDPPRKPRVVTAVAEAWHEEWQQREEFGWGHVLPEAGPWRGSYSAKRCDRQLEYAFRGMEETPDIAGIYRMALGTMVHDVFQQVMTRLFPDAVAEMPLDLREIGLPGSMRVDLVKPVDIEDPDTHVETSMQIPIELKTINGFGFKKMATNFKGVPTGPRSGHRLQLSCAIVALGAPYGILGYLSLETISPDLVEDLYRDPTPVQQFAAEWVVHRDLAEQLVTIEARRVARLLKFIEDHPDERTPREIVDEEYPAGAIVTRPENGQWVTMVDGKPTQTGKTWLCQYCDMRPQCIADGPGYVAETSVSF